MRFLLQAVRSGLMVTLAMSLALVATAQAADTSVDYLIVGDEIPQRLSAEPGNPGRGRETVRDMAQVTCLICHAMPIPEEPDHGQIGPSLIGIGSRLSEGQIRLRLVDPKSMNSKSIMPAYYQTQNLTRVQELYKERTIYSPQQLEDVVAYLTSLKDR